MQIPDPEPAKLLAAWMEWERGDVTPGRAMANLKTGGLRELLEGLAAPLAPSGSAGPGAAPPQSAPGGPTPGKGQPQSWAPVV